MENRIEEQEIMLEETEVIRLINILYNIITNVDLPLSIPLPGARKQTTTLKLENSVAKKV